MRSVIAFVVIVLGVIVRAQELPQCAAEAVGDNFGDCSAIDIGCICANDDLLSDLACKVTESCSSEEIETLLTFARNLCEPQGVTLPDSVECPGAGEDDIDDEEEAEEGDDDDDDDDAAETVTVTDSETAAANDDSPVTDTGAAAHIGVAGVGYGAAFAGLLALL